MKRLKLVSALLIIATLLQILSPAALAAQDFNMNNVCSVDGIWAYGFEDSEMIYNLLIDADKNSGQFAVKYKDTPDMLYEYIFDVTETSNIESTSFWIATIDMCFNNQDTWRSTYIPTAVQVVDDSLSGTSTYASDVYITRFTNELISLYGSEYYDSVLSNMTQGSVSMTLYQALLHRVSKDKTYLITVALTAAGFITSMLGRVIEGGILATISLILGTASMFAIGQKVYEYSLLTNWSRYVTINGGSYPYNMTDKFVMYTGYVYTASGNYAIDEASEQTIYSDSSTYYSRYALQFEDAYAEYQRIGWQG